MFILLTWLITIIHGKFSPYGVHTIPNNYVPSTHLTNKQNQASHQPLNQNEYNTTTIKALSSKTANDTIYHSKIIILSNVKICLYIQDDLAMNLFIITQSQPAWAATQSTDDDLTQLLELTDDNFIIEDLNLSLLTDNIYLNIINTYTPITMMTLASNQWTVNQQEHASSVKIVNDRILANDKIFSLAKPSSILTGNEKSKPSDLCLFCIATLKKNTETHTKKILYKKAIRISADIKEKGLKKIQKVNGVSINKIKLISDPILGSSVDDIECDYVYGEDKYFVDILVTASKNIFRTIVYVVCGFILTLVLSPRYGINVYLLALLFTFAKTQNIDCIGRFACQDMIINCNTTHEVDCIVNCAGGGQDACQSATINGGAGNLLINGDGVSSMEGIDINCPVNRYCNITCSGWNGCVGATIRGKTGTKLNIDASGDGVLSAANITCPIDVIRGGYDGKTNQCNIVVHDGDRMMNYLQIYAVESFHDVNIVCDNILFGCFEDQPAIRPKIHCTENFGSDCEFSFDINGTNWKCINPPDSICNGYLLKTPTPSANPTMEPTTFEPTFSPTRYDPNDSPHTILYVSESRGCDYGYCEDEKVDYNEYCMQPWFLSYA
eukprot:133906_1